MYGNYLAPHIIANSHKYTDQVSLGNIYGTDFLYKFGRNEAIGIAEEVVWDYGGNYAFQSSAQDIEVLSSSADDTDQGSGAWTVRIFGLDAGWNPIDEVVTMNGITPVQLTQQFLRVFRAFVTTGGTPLGISASNAGNITIRTVTGSVVQAYILAGRGQTLMAVYSVPANYDFLCYSDAVSAGQGKAITMSVKLRYSGVDGPNAPFRHGATREVYQSYVGSYFVYPIRISEKTDIIITASNTLAGDVAVSASFQGELIRHNS